MIDFHSHVLPKIDDGSSSEQESLQMLQRLKLQGVDALIATPHFYPSKSNVSDFLEKREQSLQNLQQHINEESLGLNLFLGAEVLYCKNISESDDLERLCINGTNILLLELPFNHWEDHIYKEVYEISQRGIIPLIAHIDRYTKYQNIYDSAFAFKQNGAFVQINADSLLTFFGSRKIIKMFKEDLADVLGSDTHNLISRPPNIDKARDKIIKELGVSMIEQIEQKEKILFERFLGEATKI